MIKFEDIRKVNETIKTIDVKGKEYAEVNQRIKAFRMLYPQGFIKTELLSNVDGVCIMKATAGYYDENGNEIVLGTGTAYEKENSTFINKTSYIENAETSCIGRCMGMIGLGIDTSIASAEEVQNAIANQNKPSKDVIEDLEGLIKETNTNVIDLLNNYGKSQLSELTDSEISEARTILLKKMTNKNFKK